MRSFEVQGKTYRSIPEFCHKNKVSYWKMIRLCRKYARAHKDPGVAARWALGLETLNYATEPKTNSVLRDNELSNIRMQDLRARRKRKNKRAVVDEVLPL